MFADSETRVQIPLASPNTIFSVSALQYNLILYSMLTINYVYYS